MRFGTKIIFWVAAVAFIVSSCMQEPGGNEEEREYKKLIVRDFGNSVEEALLTKAENYYPPREDIINAISTQTIAIPDSNYWYYDDFDGIRVPYCITIDAVNFYTHVIDSLNKDKPANFLITAEFNYKAEVSFQKIYYSPPKNNKGETVTPERFESVYVVHMYILWKDYCGALCGTNISRERIVIFNEEGELLKVFLDGVAS